MTAESLIARHATVSSFRRPPPLAMTDREPMCLRYGWPFTNLSPT